MEASCSRFTPAEGGARLAAAASEKNILAVEHPAFIATRLVYEHAHKIRGSLQAGRQRSVHITRSSRVALVAYDYRSLTDLTVACALNYTDVEDWREEVDCKEVIVCTSSVLKHLLEDEVVRIENLNVLILESCHLVYKDHNLKFILKLYKECHELKRPRILALTYPLFLSTRKAGDAITSSTIDTDDAKNLEQTHTSSNEDIDKVSDEGIEKSPHTSSNEDIDKVLDEDIEKSQVLNTTKSTTDGINEKICEIIEDDKLENKLRITDDAEKPQDSNEIKHTPSDTDTKISEIIENDKSLNKSNDTDNVKKSQVTDNSTKNVANDINSKICEITEIDNSNYETITNADAAKDCKAVVTDTENSEDKAIDSETSEIEKDPSTEITDTIDNEPESKRYIDTFGVYENLDDFDMYEKLEWKIEELEKEVCCQMDLAEDIDGGKRLSAILTKPKELIIEYNARPPTEELPEVYIDLEKYMKETVHHAMEFLDDHRFDLMEIYGEDYIDELQNVPDPKIVPKYFLNQFLYVLEQLGPYAADKLAYSLLMNIEKLRVKEKYDRHFLLLCLLTTVFVKIRCYTDSILSVYTDWDKIKTFSTPKMLRFIEILEKFQPTGEKKENLSKKDSTNKMMSDIEKCDFISLSQKIEDQVNTIECNLKEIIIDCNNIDEKKKENPNTQKLSGNTLDSSGNKLDISVNTLDSGTVSGNISDINKNKSDSAVNSVNIGDKSGLWFPKRQGGRTRGRGRIPRNNAARVQQMQQNPDALCGIVFMKEALMARTMFLILVDLTRCNPKLSYLCVQYCAVDNPANPCADDTKKQGKKHEDVLKMFRMHECNLLLATSALEEGIDLPRCNLVLRWDVPASYRSYGLCRGRARAPRSSNALLCCAGDLTSSLLENVATYRELDQIITRKCGCGIQNEPAQSEEEHADTYTCLVKPYAPQEKPNDVVDNTVVIVNETDEMKKNQDIISIEDEIDAENEAKIQKLSDKNKNINEVNEFVSQYELSKHSDNCSTVCKEIRNENGKNVSNFDYEHLKVENDAIENNNQSKLEYLDEFIDQNVNKEVESDNFDKVNNFNERINSEMRNIDQIGNEIRSLGDEISKLTLNSLEGHYNISLVNDNGMCDDNNGNEVDKLNNTSNGFISYNENELNIDGNNRDITTANDSYNIDIKHMDSQIDISTKRISHIDSEINCDINDKRKILKGVSPKVSKQSDRVRNNSNIDEVDSGNKVDSKKIVDSDIPNVDLSTAIPLINRYCAKLPSDTFTRLAPQWWIEEVQVPLRGSEELCTAYICTLRLPLNCPVKYNIVGHPMRTRVLARRMAALQACRILHKSGELDDQLMPIGKENFKAAELEATNYGESGDPNDAARPGTTKRRQYYYKRTAYAFTDCQPVVDSTDAQIDGSTDAETTKETRKGSKRNMLYAIVSKLSCALPERYNTRGRRLHAPQHANQAIGILMARDEPDNLQIPAFPVYTRSGEVRVSVEHVPDADVRISPRRARLVRRFMRFVFSEVLRVHRRGMKLQSENCTHNNYYVVPTTKSTREDGSTKIDIDWSFLELIYQHTEEKKNTEIEKPIIWEEKEGECKKERGNKVKEMANPLLKPGEVFEFDAEKYREAVVTPWYRNQDQPQFFLVAEICWNLSPDSAFPSATHSSFRHYYNNKYGVVLTQPEQPLLDVDHTSARLNLLTPRYVNRKGVALPVSSERTRRAKRDRLDQKQILVPELCKVHPFAAPLWFSTVALPCVLYRINALLIADEIRRAVAIDVGLGIPKIDETNCPGFQWPPLDFGWSLAEVLSADSEKCDKKSDDSVKMEDNIDNKSIEEQTQEETKEETKGEDEEDGQVEKEKTINDILQEKENAENSFEIGTWSNDMAYDIPPEVEYDEFMEPLPSNVTLVTSESGGLNWSEKPRPQYNPPRAFSMADSDCSYMSSDFDTDTDSDDSYEESVGFGSGKVNMTPSSFRIEYKTAHEAEAFDVERKKVNPAPQPNPRDDELDRMEHDIFVRSGEAPKEHIENFRKSVAEHKKEIIDKGLLIDKDQPIKDILPEVTKDIQRQNIKTLEENYRVKLVNELFPYKDDCLETLENGQISLESIEKNKRMLLSDLKQKLSMDQIKKLKCFSMVDVNIDAKNYVNEKIVNIGFDTKDMYEKRISSWDCVSDFKPYFEEGRVDNGKEFDFDYQPNLKGHPGPSPSVILQALTMSNANDGINLERLETIGDSFLKFAITAYLYCAHPTVHEGKLSHMRSKQVSNLNLYRLGRNKRLGARMIASKFEPHDNWLPPCHKPPPTLHPRGPNEGHDHPPITPDTPVDSTGCFIPYNLITQHSIPDKSIADCVEALIGAYLLECGPRGALLFMSWLGIKVLPRHDIPLPPEHPYSQRAEHFNTEQKFEPHPSPKRTSPESSDSETEDYDEEMDHYQQEMVLEDWSWPSRPVGSLRPYREGGRWVQPIFGELKAPPSPLLRYIEDPEGELEQMLSGYDALERTLQYRFKDRSLLLQALTHASHQSNRLTDCYQRLEFLGDAILDYLITRHLYEEPRRHSPGALTDLRSALVNNTIFATLAARHGFHKYFRHMSPGLNDVLTKYVKIQEENGHSISEEHYLIQEDEMEQAEDVEVPKALGDLFESVAGAIFLDSGMSLGAVWKSYVNLMGAELEAFSAAAPKSPVRELLEAEPDTAKFGKPERLADGRRVRVSVEVFGRGTFKGIGRNYRIAKGTAARCALRHLRLLHKGR